MQSFHISLEYDKGALIDAMARCHGIAHVSIEHEEDVAGVIQFLLDGAHCKVLKFNDSLTTTHIDGQRVSFALQASVDDPQWREIIESELKQFQRYIETCAH